MLQTRIDDTTLVNQLQNGDEEAYERLVRTHIDRVYSVASRVLGNGSDAQDAAQEAFLAAWKGIRGFDGRSTLSTWLHRIAVNTSLAILRSKARKREITMTDIPAEQPNGTDRERLLEPEEAQPDPVEQADTARLVWQAVDDLPEEYRLVLVMRDVEEMPSKEVASALGLSDATVRQRLHRARQTVAEKLRPELCVGTRLTCGGRLDLLFDWIDRELAPDLQEPVQSHIAACVGCRDLSDQYHQTISAPRRAWRSLLQADRQGSLVRSILEGTASA